jgi:hypothetical protein
MANEEKYSRSASREIEKITEQQIDWSQATS